jgi:hypothetical protein
MWGAMIGFTQVAQQMQLCLKVGTMEEVFADMQACSMDCELTWGTAGRAWSATDVCKTAALVCK